jgi:predicted RNA-binding Zn-ribbon protein involved in translation (DUF1610 family)
MPQEAKPPTICPKCGDKIAEFKGVSRTTGKSYHFWKCVNPDCGWIWRPPTQSQLMHDEIMNALRLVYKKLNKIENLVKGEVQEEKEIEEGEIPVIGKKKEEIKEKMNWK